MQWSIKTNKWFYIGVFSWFLLGIVTSIYQRWDTLLAVSTWILAGGLFFGALQLYQSRISTNEMRKSANAQIAVDLFEMLHKKESMDTFRFIYKLNPEDPEIIYESDKHRIEYLLDRLNILAGLVRNNIVDEDLAISTYAGVSSLRCWYILHTYIYDCRKKQNRESLYYSFEGYVHLCMEIFTRRRMRVSFESIKYKDCTVDDLVSRLQDANNEIDENKRKLYPRTWNEIEKDWRQTQEVF